MLRTEIKTLVWGKVLSELELTKKEERQVKTIAKEPARASEMNIRKYDCQARPEGV
jgi:hypothetical protein